MSNVTIRDIRTFLLKPGKVNLIVVKVITSEPGLYGLGCATFTFRCSAVKKVVEDYLRPILIGRCVDNIEDLWQLMNYSSYWRGGPIENNAISGIDMALWDIKGKMANLPVYSLLGGKCREYATVYRQVNGLNLDEVGEGMQQYLDQGVEHIRVQVGNLGAPGRQSWVYPGAEGLRYDPARYCKESLELMKFVRSSFGWDVELLHDSHERLAPQDALRFAKDMEEFRLFFLEDLLAPEQNEWLERIRSQCSVPIASGELFTHPLEWKDLVSRRLIDYIRVHMSFIGGITPARRLANFCEEYGVKVAWHGPADVSPVGHAANLHMDYSMPNFGIQEWTGFTDAELEIFPGAPRVEGGKVFLNNLPGLGIDFREDLAERYPIDDSYWLHRWQVRLNDGSLHTP